MRVSVLGAEKVIFQGAAKKVILPGINEEFCVLDFHQPFLFSLGLGLIKVAKELKDSPDLNLSFAIKKGIARMSGNELTVLAEF